jgi:hypothetical protein
MVVRRRGDEVLVYLDVDIWEIIEGLLIVILCIFGKSIEHNRERGAVLNMKYVYRNKQISDFASDVRNAYQSNFRYRLSQASLASYHSKFTWIDFSDHR